MRRAALVRTLAGGALLWGSAGTAGYAVAWTVRSHDAGHRLVAGAAASLAAAGRFDPSRSCAGSRPAAGQLAGLLEVPRLRLTAPVEQGESDAVLSAAVGHDTASVWPGEAGTAVLAAHDVSYFARIASLRPGDAVYYVSPCRVVRFEVTGQHVVKAGSPVANAGSPELVLDTCWPTDALWWTPDRLLVSARETGSSPRTGTGPLDPAPAVHGAPLAVPAPEALVAQGLTLDTNPTMLGQLTVGRRAAAGFAESPEPLAVEEAALTAYYGGLHAIGQDRPAWWSAIAPGVAFPGLLAGSSIGCYLSRLAVEVLADGWEPTGAVLSATVDLRRPDGSGAPAQLEVTCVVHNGTLVLSSWSLRP